MTDARLPAASISAAVQSASAAMEEAAAALRMAVLAPDLPGHGHSEGAALSSIAALADWTAALIDAAGVGAARLVGHSMDRSSPWRLPRGAPKRSPLSL